MGDGTREDADGATGTGRRWRRDPQWTRATLVDTLLELTAEGAREPTRKAIAERAGVSERTVFVHFADREALYVTAAERQAGRWQALAKPVPPEWPADRKVRALVAQRALMYELMTPIRKVGLRLEADSPGLRRVMADGDAWLRADLAELFAPELRRTSGARRPGGLLDALDAASSWAAWDHLRTRRGLDVGPTGAALRRTLRALLDAAGTRGEPGGV
ncbi:TetR family transcriptional regulator [Streptomyces sp. YC537]|uniref:TetR family transcriptional regulator n=2 Tax=Streptomyces boluensis TaxID=1775135 RepID=A0A964UX17_9ACTN|nr:TetR family transcriptional regulator [Streptomyces boluensis]